MHIIVKGETKVGRTRSQHEVQMRKEGMGTMSDEQLDRCQWLEKRGEKDHGSKDNFLPMDIVDGAVRS